MMSEAEPPDEHTRQTVFATTHWSVVLKAGENKSPEASAALEELCRVYWFPLYSFVRRKGYDEADAKDLTQGFFARLLSRQDLKAADARKGKFRTFLLTALTYFLANERDFAQAAKRGGGKTFFSLDAVPDEQFHRYEPATDLSPDKLFDLRWATALLEAAIARLRNEMIDDGRAVQFDALKSFLTEEPREGEYDRIAIQLRTRTQGVAVLVHRMRGRYRELVRAEVANTVASPLEVDEEMRHLQAALNY
jgi:RNA polymerase sigma-70 factor (ECF subfamily)